MAREIFNPNFSLFVAVPEAGTTFQPNPNSVVQNDEVRGTNHLDFFRFVGRIVGKALYDGQLIDAHFTRSFYKHMLGQQLTYEDIEVCLHTRACVLNKSWGDEGKKKRRKTTKRGLNLQHIQRTFQNKCQLCVECYVQHCPHVCCSSAAAPCDKCLPPQAVDPEFYKNLIWMLGNDITHVLDLNFTEEVDYFGRTETVELKPGGANIKVNEGNKREYVNLVARHRMTTAIKAQIGAFLEGFWELVSKVWCCVKSVCV